MTCDAALVHHDRRRLTLRALRDHPTVIDHHPADREAGPECPSDRPAAASSRAPVGPLSVRLHEPARPRWSPTAGRQKLMVPTRRALVSPVDSRGVRMAAPVLVARVAFARWSGTPWIARHRRVRRVRLGCSSLSRAAPAGAWLGSASTPAAAAQPTLGPRHLHPFPGAQSDQVGFELRHHCQHVEQQPPHRIGRIMDRAAKTEPDVSPRELVENVPGIRHDRASRSSLVTTKVSPARQAASASRRRVGPGWCRSIRDRHRCDHHRHQAHADRCAGR
jgi:hypothetical protein